MDDAETTIVVGAIVGVLALIAVLLRFYVRYYRGAGFWWDDWFILASILSVIAIDTVDLYGSCPQTLLMLFLYPEDQYLFVALCSHRHQSEWSSGGI